MYSSVQVPRPTDLPAPAVTSRLSGVSSVRYIKLGEAGAWAHEALASGMVPLMYHKVAHGPCAAGDWETVRAQLTAAGRKGGKVADGVRELRDFYELDEHCLWVTLAEGHLWWAFAECEVIAVAEPAEDRPARMRRTVAGWSNCNLTGEPLRLNTLSTSLTKVAGYRATICKIEREDYLLRRIRGEPEPLLQEAEQVRGSLMDVAANMIAQLDWRAFEIMVDLIFARGGWQRQSALGGDEVDADLRLTSPTTGERAWVQVKSRASQRVLDDYLARFSRDGSAERFYFVCHSPRGELRLPEQARGAQVWTGRELAHHALAAGLFDWLIERTR